MRSCRSSHAIEIHCGGRHLETEPTLLFLHGVGKGDPLDRGLAQLSSTLVELGYPSLEARAVIAPRYPNTLIASDDDEPMPAVTVPRPTRDAARRNRLEFEQRAAAIEFRLGRPHAGVMRPGSDAMIDMAIATPQFIQARNYVRDSRIRAQVLARILREVPQSGRLVIVAHSLGSVIAADLLRRLPAQVQVTGMVTIGSPLASGAFEVEALRDALKEPPTNLQWWVNFWNQLDPVAGYRGVSSVFPWMIDFPVSSGLHTRVHAATDYFADAQVVEAIGYALFGSKGRELAVQDPGAGEELDGAERLALLALRYSSHVALQLDEDRRQRYLGASRNVQATAVSLIRERNEREGRGLPLDLARLDFDFSDPSSIAPETEPARHLSKHDAVVPLLALATENVIRPYEISVKREQLQEAMEDLTAEMGLGHGFGTSIFEAVKTAQETVSGDPKVNWLKWGALGAGAAALVGASGGLALAAAPGLFGAAAITSALAAFGPGGMIGGLLTAGTLVTAGGGGLAYGLAAQATSAEAMEAVVARQLAAAIVRRDQGLEQDPAIWRALVETEVEVRREHERLDEFSDPKAPAVMELARKTAAIERALEYLRTNGMSPVPALEEPEARGTRWSLPGAVRRR